jgi:hypothetical protein
MKTNGSTDLARASVGQRLASLSRFRTSAILLVVLVVLLVGPSVAISSTIPTVSITNVVADQSVSLTTYNYPAGQNFVVTMGPMGSTGINGYYVTTINSGAGGSFALNDLPIPPQLKGSYQIAIRLESAQGYYSYNWFYNNTTGPGQGGKPGYSGIPTFKIVSVNADQDVTVETNNFPANEMFTWTMGPMGTRGINGTVVSSGWNSGNGGTMTATFAIPDHLKGSYQIAIRAQTGHTYPLIPFYAYNWFYNNTSGTGGEPSNPSPGYTGVPTFKVCSVVQNGQVTIRTNNFPANQVFTVTMGSMGTAGIGGYVVGQIDSGSGGSFDATFPIPAELSGQYRIAIRAQTGHAYPFFAYNWFYNNSATVC